MPLTGKGEEILANMKKEYGAATGEKVFYASRNKSAITGVDTMSGTFDPAASPVIGGYQLVKGDAKSDYKVERKSSGSWIIVRKSDGKQISGNSWASEKEAREFLNNYHPLFDRQNDAVDEWCIYKQIGPYTIYKGTGKKDGKYLVKGVGENSEMSTYSQAFDLVQHLMRY